MNTLTYIEPNSKQALDHIDELSCSTCGRYVGWSSEPCFTDAWADSHGLTYCEDCSLDID